MALTPDSSNDGYVASPVERGNLPQALQPPQQVQLGIGRAKLSCVSCRQRKVKCDKIRPCGPCRRSDIDCVFPSRARNTRRQLEAQPRDSELLQRISRLEDMLERAIADKRLNGVLKSTRKGPPFPMDAAPSANVQTSGSSDQGTIADPALSNRYLAGDFWVSLSDDLDGLKQLLEQASLEDVEEAPSADVPVSSIGESSQVSPSGFPFGNHGNPLSHPPPKEAAYLIETYFSNIDPIFKVLHRPTVMGLLPKTVEFFADPPDGGALPALLFSMYFGAVTSMSSEDCLNHLHQERSTLVARYKDSTERALANADFMNSLELMNLQAFAIYLVRFFFLQHIALYVAYCFSVFIARSAH
jgi:hypothetical protein